MASTTLITLLHTWYGLPYLLVPFRRSGAPLRQNPSHAGAEPNLSPTALTGDLKSVAMCNSLLGCVRVDTRKSQDNGMTQLFTRFPLVSPFRKFRASSACRLEREREVDVREAPNRKSGVIFGIYNPYHTCSHMVWPPTCWFRSDAPEPLYGKTLAPLEQSQAYRPQR